MPARTKKIIFVTGTDTGVGKTLLTALLLYHLRQTGVHALAMKPFCSGGRGDVRLLQSVQRGQLTDAEMNPFYFEEAVAPLVAAKQNRKNVSFKEAVARINHTAAKCECLLVEGSGGLLVPLGENYTVADLIDKLDCHVIVAARNRLGTINHTLLTIKVLRPLLGIGSRPAVALMEQGNSDISSRTNFQVLTSLLKPLNVFKIPFLTKKASRFSSIQIKYPAAKGVLARILADVGR